MGFVFVRSGVLETLRGQFARRWRSIWHDQWAYMEKTTQWRFTPPTHVVVALNAALEQYIGEGGGQPARLARYTRNCETLVAGMARAGLPARSSIRRSRRRSS